MARLRYLDSAASDLLNIFDFVTRESGSLVTGQRFVASLRRKCRHLADLPGHLGRPRPELRPDMRSFAVGHYVIFFRYVDDVFEVVNILEGHRDVSSAVIAGTPDA